MANETLSNAKRAKKDEFYTQLSDIENELRHYKQHFKGKTVLCNCDDPKVSNFFVYFVRNFYELGLKRLITTCYKNNQPDLFSQNDCEQAVWLDYRGGDDNNPDVTKVAATAQPMKGDGDFRSKECIELLQQADIVVTNPPFSLFREYVAQLIKYEKKFLIIGRMSALHYNDIFPLIKENKIWCGFGFNMSLVYKTPSYTNNLEANRKFVKSRGYDPDDNFIKVPAICWFTNLVHSKRNEWLDLYKKYTPEEYPKYCNCEAIDVSDISSIPLDYSGIMGVPDTYLGQYNPQQFELIGMVTKDTADILGVKRIGEDWIRLYKSQGGTGHTTANMKNLVTIVNGKAKQPYSRILIRKKQK